MTALLIARSSRLAPPQMIYLLGLEQGAPTVLLDMAKARRIHTLLMRVDTSQSNSQETHMDTSSGWKDQIMLPYCWGETLPDRGQWTLRNWFSQAVTRDDGTINKWKTRLRRPEITSKSIIRLKRYSLLAVREGALWPSLTQTTWMKTRALSRCRRLWIRRWIIIKAN